MSHSHSPREARPRTMAKNEAHNGSYDDLALQQDDATTRHLASKSARHDSYDDSAFKHCSGDRRGSNDYEKTSYGVRTASQRASQIDENNEHLDQLMGYETIGDLKRKQPAGKNTAQRNIHRQHGAFTRLAKNRWRILSGIMCLLFILAIGVLIGTQIGASRDDCEGTGNCAVEVTTAAEEPTVHTSGATSRPTPAAELCEIRYKDICYWSEVRSTMDMNFQRGEEICSEKSSKPAVVYDSTSYNMIMNHVRGKITGRWFVDVWMGIRYNTKTNVATFEDGTAAPYIIWYPGYPKSDSSYTHFALEVNQKVEQRSQGLFNWPPSSTKVNGVVCQI